MRWLYIAIIFILAGNFCYAQDNSQNLLEPVLEFSKLYKTDRANSAGLFKAFADKVDTSGKGVPVVVFNPSSWQRTDFVEVQSPFAGQNLPVTLTDSSGKAIAGQNQGDRLYFTAQNVPALGYKVYNLTRSAPASAARAIGKDFAIDNQFVRVQTDSYTGSIRSYFDKKNKRDIFGSGSGLPVVTFEGKTEALGGETEVVLMESGPASARLTYDHYYIDSQINQDILVYDALNRMDMVVTVDWQQEERSSRSLGISFALADACSAIASGNVPIAKDNSQPNSKTGSHWAKLTMQGMELVVCADKPVEYALAGNMLTVWLSEVLLESAGSDAADAPELRLSFYPVKGSIPQDKLLRLAMQRLAPLPAIVATAHKGALAKTASLISLDNPAVAITKARCDDYMGTLALNIQNLTDKPASAELETTLKFSSYSWNDSSVKTKPAGGKIELLLPENAAGLLTLIR